MAASVCIELVRLGRGVVEESRAPNVIVQTGIVQDITSLTTVVTSTATGVEGWYWRVVCRSGNARVRADGAASATANGTAVAGAIVVSGAVNEVLLACTAGLPLSLIEIA